MPACITRDVRGTRGFFEASKTYAGSFFELLGELVLIANRFHEAAFPWRTNRLVQNQIGRKLFPRTKLTEAACGR
jgi:hypothetical protein